MLFAIAYLLLFSTLQHQEKDVVILKVREIRDLYREGGIWAVEGELTYGKKFRRKDPFFVRLADSQNRTLLLSLPYQWIEFDIKRLRLTHPRDLPEWVRIPAVREKQFLLVANRPLDDGNWLQVGKSTEDRMKLLFRFRSAFLAAMIPLVILGFSGGAFLAFRTLRPIRNLIRTIRSMDVGRMEARVPSPDTGDELDELIQLFNEMISRIEALIRGMRDSMDMVAHDLRTPMTRLRGVAEMALHSGQKPEDYKEALAECIEESERILQILDTLMDISEAETGAMKLELEEVDLADLLEDLTEVYRYVAEEKGLRLDLRTQEGLLVEVDSHRLGRALSNLLDNAVKYTPSGGRVEVEARRHEQSVIVQIRDTGEGIPERDLPRIWDRLYRGESSRSHRGLGLGLSLVRAIVKAHGGRIEVESQPGHGSCFSLYLPSPARSS